MNSKKFTRTALLLYLVLLCNTHAHAQWQWAHSYYGTAPAGADSGPNSHYNFIQRSHLDNEGNIYIFGTFGRNATLNGQGELDPRTGTDWQNGIIVAKMGADGDFIWKKVVRYNTAYVGTGHVKPYWAEFKEDAIYISFDFQCRFDLPNPSEALDFFGTEKNFSQMMSINTPPFKHGRWTAFVKYSYEGEILDKHFIKYIHRQSIESYLNSQGSVDYSVLSGITLGYPVLFHVDNSGNTYIFTDINLTGGSIEMPFCLGLNEEEYYEFYIPKAGQGKEPLMIKLNSDWRVEWIKPIYHTITNSYNDTIKNPSAHYVTGLSFDEEDNIYFINQISFIQGDSDFDDDDAYPLHIYLDEAQKHKVVINHINHYSDNGFIVKYDTDGNVKWCNQIHSKLYDGYCCMKGFYGVEILDNEVYILGDAENNGHSKIYFLNGEEEIEITSPYQAQYNRTFLAKFDKETGQYINHDIIPNEIRTYLHPSYSAPLINSAIINDHIIFQTAFGLNANNTVLASFRADSCKFVGVLDTISMIPRGGKGVRANNQGKIFTHFVSEEQMRFGTLPPVNISQNSAVFALKNDPRILVPYNAVSVANVSLDMDTIILTMGENETEQLNATVSPYNASTQSVMWSSSKPSVASVSSSGFVTAHSADTAVITVRTYDRNYKAKCVVIVNAVHVDVTGITLNKNTTTLKVDNTEQLIATVLPTNASNKNVSWLSSAPAIASVDNGIVTALSEGAATITATTQNGNFSAYCAVTVTKNSSGIDDVSANSIKIYPNPVNGQLRITNYELREGDYTIFNVLGQAVGANLCVRPSGAETTIDVSHLPSGVYFIKIGNEVGKFIKE